MTQYITDSREKVQTQALWNDIQGLQSFWMLFRSLERIRVNLVGFCVTQINTFSWTNMIYETCSVEQTVFTPYSSLSGS